jgi:hypothetical protein
LLLLIERRQPLECAGFLCMTCSASNSPKWHARSGANEAACRQVAARARTHIAAGRPGFPALPDAAPQRCNVLEVMELWKAACETVVIRAWRHDAHWLLTIA